MQITELVLDYSGEDVNVTGFVIEENKNVIFNDFQLNYILARPTVAALSRGWISGIIPGILPDSNKKTYLFIFKFLVLPFYQKLSSTWLTARQSINNKTKPVLVRFYY